MIKRFLNWAGFSNKNLWDWLQLAGIPLIVALATIMFGLLQLDLAGVQHQQDQASALDQQQAAILQTYIDNIQDLLLNHHLQQSSPSDSTNPYYEIAILAQARTLTALQGLDQDPERKAHLLMFLYEAKLIGFIGSKDQVHPSIINLSGADLHDADLRGANLITADLSVTNLSGANFNGADLSGASLLGANLSSADLNGAILRHTNLTKARNLSQQQLDQVLTCRDAPLPKGLTCHHNR